MQTLRVSILNAYARLLRITCRQDAVLLLKSSLCFTGLPETSSGYLGFGDEMTSKNSPKEETFGI